MLAVFGLSSQGDHCIQAINCAIRIRQKIEKWNHERHENSEHLPELKIGVGIHSGSVAIGRVELAKEFQSILIVGDVVNTASRMEALSKELGVDVLVSEATQKMINHSAALVPMPAQEIRGKKGLYQTYWLEPTAVVREDVHGKG